jgi:hypothetical protein
MIFRELDSTDKVSGRVTSIHDGMFSGEHPSELDSFYYDEDAHANTPLSQTHDTMVDAINHMTDNWTLPQKEDYYADIYHEEVYIGGLSNQAAEQQFSVTYGHIDGYGSPLSQAFDSKSPKITKAIYSQYKNILLNPDDKKFTFTQSIVRNDGTQGFVGYNSDSIYAINFSTARMKERLDEGNFVVTLGVTVDGNPSSEINYRVSFQDNSVFGTGVNYIASSPQFGRVFDLVKVAHSDRYNSDSEDVARMVSTPEDFVDNSGSDIRYCPKSNLSFGLVYPDLGVIILNPVAVAEQLQKGLHQAVLNDTAEGDGSSWPIGYSEEENEGAKFAWFGEVNPNSHRLGDVSSFNAQRDRHSEIVTDSNTWKSLEDLYPAGGDRNYQNFTKLVTALQVGKRFECRNTELIPSKHYFIRIKNTDFNYSNNPSFVYQGYEADVEARKANASKDDYMGRVRFNDFINDPRVYITTIGLYNEDNELVAVAKLSKPILKTFDSEALVKVKLDF